MFDFNQARALRASSSLGVFLALSLFVACDSGNSDQPAEKALPTADSGQEKALAIADEVLEAVGGQENWDATRYVTWVNHGKRLEVWDKQSGDIRVQNDATVVVMNVNTGEGKAWMFGEEITEPDRLERVLEWGYEAFLLDRHEILLPFMLRDEGFILDYVGEGEISDRPVDILKVTFDEGAPYSRAEYHLHIDKESKLLVQWDYYMDRGDATPRVELPWSNYENHGKIRLSDLRGMKQHQDVNVFEELPASVFESPESVPWLRAEE